LRKLAPEHYKKRLEISSPKPVPEKPKVRFSLLITHSVHEFLFAFHPISIFSLIYKELKEIDQALDDWEFVPTEFTLSGLSVYIF